jgi:FMN phosphatase YigB (HAD superfamily)
LHQLYRYPPLGLAVDKETGWICHLSYTHKVAVAWEGREKMPTSRIYKEYRGKRALTPKERRGRLKPLNDLFSMAECCLIADTIQFFKDREIDFSPRNAVTDCLLAIGATHISGDFHRIVADDPKKYLEPTPNLKGVLEQLKGSGKRLIFASNSPFWYVDAGMKYVLGDDWMQMWDAGTYLKDDYSAESINQSFVPLILFCLLTSSLFSIFSQTVIVSAGKPAFYTEKRRPFREINKDNSRIKFKKVMKFEPGEVYTEGCLRELTRLMDWSDATGDEKVPNKNMEDGALSLAASNVLYVGDSLFADLVDAKREFGWMTAAVTPEVGFEMEIQKKSDYVMVERTIEFLLNALRMLQIELGPSERTKEDTYVLDSIEKLVSKWRDRETGLLANPFGSIFRARYQPSLFAHSLRRYCDMYMSSVGNLINYSPQHRFYPEQDFRLLAHEIRGAEPECWVLDDVLSDDEGEE